MVARIEPRIGNDLTTPTQHPRFRHLCHQQGGQRVADTNDADQQVASGMQFGILVDRLADGPVDRLKLGGEMIDCRGGQLGRGGVAET